MKGKAREVLEQLGELIGIHTVKRFNDVEIVSLIVELNELQVVEVEGFIEFNGADVSLAKHLEHKANVRTHGEASTSPSGISTSIARVLVIVRVTSNVFFMFNLLLIV